MEPKNDGGPYHPLILPTKAVNGVVTENNVHPGARLRDHFAGLALQGMLSGMGLEVYGGHDQGRLFAGIAYDYADSMLAERERGR